MWEWGGRERPLPKFVGTLAFKKSGTSCPKWGRGSRCLDKIQKNSYFFSGNFPLVTCSLINALVFPPAPFPVNNDSSKVIQYHLPLLKNTS